MGLRAELAQQRDYFGRLRKCVGFAAALRVRALMWLGPRLGLNTLLRLRPRGAAHPVLVRARSTDPLVYGQVFAEEQYGAVSDIPPPRTIVDCGANAGYASAYLLSRFPAARLVAVEPFADSAEMCRRNLAPYGDRAEVLQAAVWSRAGRLVVEGYSGHEWGVRVREAAPGEAGDVAAVGLGDLGLGRIDLLKVDIEGSEAVLFREGVEAWLPRVSNIAIELHGPECEAALAEALRGYTYTRSASGELTVIRGLRREAAAGAPAPPG